MHARRNDNFNRLTLCRVTVTERDVDMLILSQMAKK